MVGTPLWLTDPGALAANARGDLTPAQRAAIAGDPVRWPWPEAVATVGLVPVPLVLFATHRTGVAVFAATMYVWLVAFVFGLYAQRRSARRQRVADLVRPLVRSDLGEVRAPGPESAATLVARGQPAHIWRNRVQLPEPGGYLVYWLRLASAGGAYLLSVRPLPATAWPAWPPEIDPSAPTPVFGGPAELAANRTGRLGQRQRRRIRREVRRARGWFVVALPVAVLAVALIPIVVRLAVTQGEYGQLPVAVLPAGVAAIVIAGLVDLIRRIRRLRTVLADPAPVRTRAGPVWVRREDDGCGVDLGDLRFTVTESEAEAFTEAWPYAIYFLAVPLRLLTAVPALGPVER